ncbi:hypothetical protein HanRHA438_Chr11g0516321 [Helianthus annuus]|nr:hypothetical protein HanRHA438_Chr11g0516321 [Helianthus annuus]
MLRIRLNHRLQQQSRLFNIRNLRITSNFHTLQISQVPFWVNNSQTRNRIGQPIQLQRQNRPSTFPNRSQIRRLRPRRLRPTNRPTLRIQRGNMFLLLPRLLKQSIRHRHKTLEPLLLVTQRIIPNLRYTIPLRSRQCNQLPLQISKLFRNLRIRRPVLLNLLLQPRLAPILPPRIHPLINLVPHSISLFIFLIVFSRSEQSDIIPFKLIKLLILIISFILSFFFLFLILASAPADTGGSRGCPGTRRTVWEVRSCTRRTDIGPGGETGGSTA